ncbi:larval serum protein 1 beta chain-like [Musca vetustissima]|uniref:larval serum protein 1 beta chain-like n=1 Tax=Musca vetustissima TaxID=27455 RepID=UPI002AB7CC41|nr:larval serum protein 1 beta chain-like [Musca vetustissima]
MKFAIALLACLGLAVAASILPQVKVADKDFLEKQKFLLEIVYRVTDPLMFDEWIKLGNTFVTDRSYYSHYDEYMEKFWESFKLGTILPRGEFFGALVATHHQQAWGLFNFFYFAKDWETFRQNVCWARMHINEGMFVYALSMAVIHREDFNGLVLPAIYEIFPQHFFNSDLIHKAEKFDYNVWKKLTMYEHEYKEHFGGMQMMYNHSYYHDNEYMKVWQWWKQMGLKKNHWYAEENFMLRENIKEFNQDDKWNSLLKDTQMWWMPVDYTRDIEFYNRESALSYLTEDLGWMSFWYYLNMDQAFFLDSDTFGSNGRRGEFWLYAVHKVMSRYYMERLSHGFGEIPEFYWLQQIEHGYKPQLVAYNGIGFSYRPNYYDFKTYTNLDMFNKIQNAFQRIYDIIDMGYYRMHDGQIIDLRHENALEHISNLVQGNIDVFDKYFFNYYYMLSHMFISQVGRHDVEVSPSVMLNFETMVRDPYFYIFHKKIADAFLRFKGHLKPYSKNELLFTGVEIEEVQITELVTYFDLVDFDVTTLLNDKMIFHDGKLVWNKALLARQMRLNHKPFRFDLSISSDKKQQALLRVFLAPKYDENGQLLAMDENRENFLTLGKFAIDLIPGKNKISYSSDDFYWTQKDRSTYTELYHYVMMAMEGNYEFPLNTRESYCLFPDRLILPRGWTQGMPMRMFFMVTPYEITKVENSSHITSYSCGFGYGGRFTDDKPLFYPFDREISMSEFDVPNMYFKDVKIYHEDKFEKYSESQHQMDGKFDYTFLNNYYKN